MMASSAAKSPQGLPNAAPAIAEYPPASFYGVSKAEEGGPINGHAKTAFKPPLAPVPHELPQQSDSELSEISEGDQGSDYELQDDLSDDSLGRKRKRGAEHHEGRKRFRTPEDNEMRRKLRGNGTQDDSSRQPSAERASEARSEGEEDPTAVPERVVSPEDEAAQKAALTTSWELVTVLDFLSIFRPYLKLEHLQFSADELGSALVLSNGTSGLLPALHMGIMKGISSRSNLHIGNWTTSLAEKLKIHWRVGGLSGRPPFVAPRRLEAATYASLPLQDRLTALRILCELRLDKDDLHNVVEYALHPPRKTKAERKAAAAAAKAGRTLPPDPTLPTMAQMRREPLARDGSGLMYWYLDYHTTTGTRMYRETPEHLLRAKGKKEQSEPQWELVASTPEDLTELGERLRRSKKKPDQNLANTIQNDIIPELMERREADLRKQRAAARMQSQLNNILPDEEGGYGGRSRRNRKTVNYSFDAYDAAIRAALRNPNRQDELDGRATRSQAFLESRMTAEEEAQLGLRRGRSAHAAEDAHELPTRRVKLNSAEPTPQPTAEPTPETSFEPSAEPQEPEAFPQRIPDTPTEDLEDDPSVEGDATGGRGSFGGIEPRWRSPSMGSAGQESAEVEISELGSRDDYYEESSPEAGEEDISSLSGNNGEVGDEDMDYEDDPKDKDWI